MNPLYIAAGLLAIVVVVMIVRYPLLGLMLIVAVNPFDYILAQQTSVTIGRPLGVLVAVAWLGRVAVVKRGTAMTRHAFWNVLLLAFIAVMVVSTVRSRQPDAGLPIVLTISLLISMSMFLQDFIEKREDLMRFVWVIALAMGASSLVGILQFRELQAGTGGDVVGYYDTMRGGYRLSGLRSNPNGYATMLMSGLPFLFFLLQYTRRFWARAILLTMVIAAVVSVFLTVSRTHVVGMVVFVMAYYLLRLRYGRMSGGALFTFLGITAVLLALVVMLPDFIYGRLVTTTMGGDASTRTRYGFIVKAVNLVSEEPWLGVGIGNFGFYEPFRGMNPHDVISFVLSGVGLLGTGLLCLIILDAFLRMSLNVRRFARLRDRTLFDLSLVILAAFVAQVVSGAGHVLLFQRMFWIYIALAVVLSRAEEQGLVRRDDLADAIEGSRLPAATEASP